MVNEEELIAGPAAYHCPSSEERLRWTWKLLFRKERPDTLSAFTTKICVLLCLSRRVSRNLEPTIKRVELIMKPSVLDTCLLHELKIS